ncbi:MAG: Ldh family oxidoreductase [Planctomycetota bacterium]|nr:Ldh family oxidoreductase [Planctomycetota bacterium]MDA1165381.1 Ldh family oxidoreductase [Planctomycetota bacterium]
MASTTLDIPRDPGQEISVPVDLLKKLIVAVLVRKGMFEVEADIVAARLTEADLRGIHSHGSRTLGKYVAAIDAGDIDPRAISITACETPAIAVVEASGGMGHVAATRGMELAIAKAREVGTGTVVIRKGQHYGAAGVYTMLAAREGMIGFSTTSTGTATVAAYGSTQPGTANNALSWAIPTSSGDSFVLDTAIAESSWGKIETLGMFGLPIPPGWALDGAGAETTDSSAAKTLLPMSGARGSALGFVASALTSALIGRRNPIHKTPGPFGPGSDHFFQAIDPSHFGAPDRFLKEIDATIASIRALAPADGFDKVRIAGELEWERAEQWSTTGIPFHRDQISALTEVCKSSRCDLPEGWPLV